MVMPSIPVPETLRTLVLKQRGHILREAKDKARLELARLGVRDGSELHRFFMEFQIGLFLSSSSDEELSDLCAPTPQIAAGTTFVREVWGLPQEYLCLTSAQGEGCYLYSNVTEAVYDFFLFGRDEFLEMPSPRWSSFFEFMHWYLAPLAPEA